MTDEELIRRGDALQILDDLSQVDGCFGDAHEAIAALPAVTVGVRPLVWKGDSIRVTANGMGKYYSCMRMFHEQKGAGWECDEGDWHPSLDAAKAVAQSDFKARILAALEHVNEPPKSEHDAGNVLTPDPAAIREAALREAAECAIDNQDCSPWEISDAILALIPKETTK